MRSCSIIERMALSITALRSFVDVVGMCPDKESNQQNEVKACHRTDPKACHRTDAASQ